MRGDRIFLPFFVLRCLLGPNDVPARCFIDIMLHTKAILVHDINVDRRISSSFPAALRNQRIAFRHNFRFSSNFASQTFAFLVPLHEGMTELALSHGEPLLGRFAWPVHCSGDIFIHANAVVRRDIRSAQRARGLRRRPKLAQLHDARLDMDMVGENLRDSRQMMQLMP